MSRRSLTVLLAAAAAAVLGVAGVGRRPVAPDPGLAAFARGRPPVPVVFTSRSTASAFEAAPPEADGFTYPGTIPFAAAEGRLRRLDPDGRVTELTWGRPLPGGGTLVDVLAPSVSLDGTRVLFAGRRADPDPGRWRLYQVDLDGGHLTPLTGGPGDAGCVATPPMRFAADGTALADADRRRTDYDDLDPTDLGPNGFAFASSRLPDFGRDSARRALQLWRWPAGGAGPVPLTASRAADRWPVLVGGDRLVFSLWSRGREAVPADRSGVRPVGDGGPFATAPSDGWMAARVTANAAEFGYAVKPAEPVWRPRPLFNGRVAYTTAGRPYRLAQADWGTIGAAPSSLAAGQALPAHGGAVPIPGPDRDADGRPLSAGQPSAVPGGRVVFAAAPVGSPDADYGLYMAGDDWAVPPAAEPLFDDPRLCDAEPVAAYPRELSPGPRAREPSAAAIDPPPPLLRLAGGREYRGPMGYFENIAAAAAVRSPIPWQPAGPADPRRDPLVPPPPGLAAMVVYANRRDRFDHPTEPRVPGRWELLATVRMDDPNDFRAWLPSDPLVPVALAGLDAGGKVVRWAGRGGATYYAFAGDHASGVRAGGYHYCNGCHAGHTFTSADVRERTR
jgi:hypothetical protein